MSSKIIAYFDWRCPIPLARDILPTLERALLDCAPLLNPMGLLGEVGNCEVWAVDEEPEWPPANAVVVHRLDRPEMKVLLGPASTAIDLSLLWGFYAAPNRKAEVSRLVLEIARHFPVSEAFVAPYGLDASADQAFEKMYQGRDFAEVRESLVASRFAWGFKKDGINGWMTLRKA